MKNPIFFTSVREYFNLRYLLINRHLNDDWLPPVVSYPLFAIAFTGFSIFLFYKLVIIEAEFLYIITYLYFISNLSGKQRNDFLKICFGDKHSKIIRALENLIVALPFIVFLLLQSRFAAAAIVFALGLISSCVNTPEKFSIVIPTPFFKNPFEFIVGFRNTFYIIAFAYTLTIIAVSVDNFSLGSFSLTLVLLIAAGYYHKSENSFHVWQFALSPAGFLFYKIRRALWYSLLLSSPVILTLLVFYFKRAGILLAVFTVGFAFLSTVILAKYSRYPADIDFVSGIPLASCLFFPPLMAIAIPYFFKKSVKKLSVLLKLAVSENSKIKACDRDESGVHT